MATLEQLRAQHAWVKAQQGVGAYGKEYVNEAKGLPALIMNSGLMQVMAFLHEKNGRHEMLATHLRDWLSHKCGTKPEFAPFMTELMQMDARQFQAVTAEAFAWLKWLRQIAPAVAKGN
jgi:CRISPR-associated protein Cmr5